MCALSVLLIVSCSKKKDEPVTPEQPKLPTIEFVNAGENYVYQDTEVIRAVWSVSNSELSQQIQKTSSLQSNLKFFSTMKQWVIQ